MSKDLKREIPVYRHIGRRIDEGYRTIYTERDGVREG